VSPLGLSAAAATVSATAFTAWALYISVVEHPARLDSGGAAGRAQFRPSYRRAAPWQASFAVIGCLAGIVGATLTGRWSWLVGALSLGGVIPLTLIVIMPTNRRLLAPEPLGDSDALRLLRRWGRLHVLRTILGGVGLLAFLSSLQPR
jgi:Anthrone oxygenase